MTRSIKNRLHGHHFNSSYWQNYKKTLDGLPQDLFDIAVGMVLGDATMYHVSFDACIKFEQGVNQKQFLFHLFQLFSGYCFMQKPGIRYEKSCLKIKSYWFKTFSFADFTRLFTLFYEKTENSGRRKWKKRIQPNLLRHYLTPKGFTYWVMCDGSLQKDNHTLILHTQSFNFQENTVLQTELNEKFGLHSRVIPHKTKYYVLEIPRRDSEKVHELMDSFILPSMRYKLPKKAVC